jgi:hypothetical protein
LANDRYEPGRLDQVAADVPDISSLEQAPMGPSLLGSGRCSMGMVR